MEFKDLLTNVPLLAKELGLNSMKVKLVLDIMADGKLTKPDLEFKAITPKLTDKKKHPFLFIKAKKGSFFFYNFDFPMLKKDVQASLSAAENSLKSAIKKKKKKLKEEVDEEEIITMEGVKGPKAKEVFFSTLLNLIKTKKIIATYGKITHESKSGNVCSMALMGMIKGEHNTPSKLAAEIKAIGIDLVARNGNILEIFDPNPSSSTSEETVSSDKITEGSDLEGSDLSNETVDVSALVIQKKEIIAEYKTFSITEMAAVKSEKSSASVQAAWDKGNEIADKIKEWLDQANDNSELSKEIASINTANGYLTGMLTKLAPTIEKIKEKSNAALAEISGQIKKSIQELIGDEDYLAQINQIDGLKGLLENLGKPQQTV